MKKNANWIAYVGPFPFPWGQAASRRMCGNARSLADAGYKVIVGGGDSLPAVETDLDEGEIKGVIRYIGLSESPSQNSSIVQKSIQVFWSWGGKTIEWLNSQKTKPAYVFVYGGAAQYMLRLLPWCRKNNIPLIVDVVEWYDPKQLTGGLFGPFNISAKLALRYLYPKCDGVVAISQLLADYYESKGCAVVRVPPTIDVAGINISQRPFRQDDSKLILVYAGTPGKKDMLGNVINAVVTEDPLGCRLKLLVIGPTLDQVKALCRTSELPPCVDVLGRIPQSEVADYVRSADFSILLREPLRFANAGFPTKFVESLANGTPVIANLTSDLGFYLRDGVEGLVCVDYSSESLVVALRRALSLSSLELTAMRKAAREQAERSFDFRVYVKPLSDFLMRV